ncbi:MAG: hypothetical protein ACXWZP_05950 [Gaiellaceae bacterium]
MSADHPDRPDALFVQSATALESDGDTLTLHAPSASTVYFTEGPQREAGHLPTRRFVELWDAGGGFADGNPTAVLSFVEPEDGSGAPPDAVVTLGDPRLDGDTLSYVVALVEGQLPAAAGPCAVFIDALASPWSPALPPASRRRRRSRR